MNSEAEHAAVLLVTGTLIALSLLINRGLRKTAVPPIVGYLLLGVLLRVAGDATNLLTEDVTTELGFLADIGVVALLFRVGLESDLAGLLRQLRKAQFVWLGDVVVSGTVGFLAAYYVLQYPLIPSLYVAAALTATSVSVSVVVWQNTHTLETPNGELLLDVAELDDISAILLMSLLFAVVPALKGENSGALLPTIAATAGLLLLKLLLFGGFCYLFARFAEHRLTRFFERLNPMPDPMLMLAGTGFIIAALAGLLGFAIALGAFFAGLVFSRDPEAITMSRPFVVLYDLFTPFFFIVIGLHIDPLVVSSALIPGAILLLAAVSGKFVGAGGAAVPSIGWRGSLLLGISMFPRAEIAMIVMRQGREADADVVPAEAFAAMVFVSAATCILSPLILRPMLDRWKQRRVAEPGTLVSPERNAP